MHSHALIFIQDLAVIMLVAGLMTILCHRFKQPIVFGYILAGIIIGPHTPPFSFISDKTTINTLAEIGVIFLMFSLGLEFSLPKLSKVGFPALVTALLEIVLMIWLGYQIGQFFNWSYIDSLFLGALLSVSSTTIIVKALDELGLKRESFAQLIFGVLIIEDIFAILILALLSSIAVSGSLDAKEIFITTTKLSSFLVVSLLAGILLIPRLLSYVAKFQSNEMLLITVLGLCFGFCLLVVHLNYSIALGAFVIGAIIAESQQVLTIERLVEPLKDMFSAIFFVSVGLLFDLSVVRDYWLPIVVITLAVIFGKILSCSIGTALSGRDGKTSMRVGLGLSQIGEFSFIIASLGITLKVTSHFLYPIAVAVSAITTLSTPYFIKYSDTITRGTLAIIPSKVVNTFGLYGTWLRNIKLTPEQAELRKQINRSLLQIVLNLFVVAAIFLAGAFIATTGAAHVLRKITSIYTQKAIIWGVAFTFSLPFLIAVYRKIKALSMILAELSIRENADSRLTSKVRKIISEMIPIVALIGIMFFIFVLSASFLPPAEWLLIVLIIMAILIALLAPMLIKLHSKLQISLIETLKKENLPE